MWLEMRRCQLSLRDSPAQGICGSSWSPLKVSLHRATPLAWHPHTSPHPKSQRSHREPLLQPSSAAPNARSTPLFVTRPPFGRDVAGEGPNPALWDQPSPPERSQGAVPTSPTWLCHPQTSPKALSPQGGQGGDRPPAATINPAVIYH